MLQQNAKVQNVQRAKGPAKGKGKLSGSVFSRSSRLGIIFHILMKSVES